MSTSKVRVLLIHTLINRDPSQAWSCSPWLVLALPFQSASPRSVCPGWMNEPLTLYGFGYLPTLLALRVSSVTSHAFKRLVATTKCPSIVLLQWTLVTLAVWKANCRSQQKIQSLPKLLSIIDTAENCVVCPMTNHCETKVQYQSLGKTEGRRKRN